MMTLRDDFPEGPRLLDALFGIENVDFARLDEIHAYTEDRWREYFSGIPGGRVRYLLIAEAPPWTKIGRPRYMLDPLMGPSRSRFLPAVCQAFFGDLVYRNWEARRKLSELAKRGFLLIDSIPFAMKYLSDQRRGPRYAALVQYTSNTYLQEKLAFPGLIWAKRIRVSFGAKLNALALMASLENKLMLANRLYPLTTEMIAVDGSGQPNGTALRRIFALGP